MNTELTADARHRYHRERSSSLLRLRAALECGFADEESTLHLVGAVALDCYVPGFPEAHTVDLDTDILLKAVLEQQERTFRDLNG